MYSPKCIDSRAHRTRTGDRAVCILICTRLNVCKRVCNVPRRPDRSAPHHPSALRCLVANYTVRRSICRLARTLYAQPGRLGRSCSLPLSKARCPQHASPQAWTKHTSARTQLARLHTCIGTIHVQVLCLDVRARMDADAWHWCRAEEGAHSSGKLGPLRTGCDVRARDTHSLPRVTRLTLCGVAQIGSEDGSHCAGHPGCCGADNLSGASSRYVPFLVEHQCIHHRTTHHKAVLLDRAAFNTKGCTSP